MGMRANMRAAPIKLEHRACFCADFARTSSGVLIEVASRPMERIWRHKGSMIEGRFLMAIWIRFCSRARCASIARTSKLATMASSVILRRGIAPRKGSYCLLRAAGGNRYDT